MFYKTNRTEKNSLTEKGVAIIFLIFLFCSNINSQNVAVSGVIKDSITQKPISFSNISFLNLSGGTYSKDDGTFSLKNNKGITHVTVSCVGYDKKQIDVGAGTTNGVEILLRPASIELKEVVINPTKEKYTKKGNPAVELIQKVIANKDRNNILKNQDYIENKRYERLVMAFNDFKPDGILFKDLKFLPNYIDTSAIDQKPILPMSIRETVSSNYYRKTPKSEKKLIRGYHFAGIDNAIKIDGAEAYIAETFKDISIYDNNISLLLTGFVGPLNEHLSTAFYKWYMMDTVSINGQNYASIGFLPFYTRDIGLSGYLYISTDGAYAIKKAQMRIPKKANINFVEELIIDHEFEEIIPNVWAPSMQRMSMDMSLYNTLKIHVDKVNIYNNYQFEQSNNSIFDMRSPVLYEDRFDERTADFWTQNRPPKYNNDYRMDELMAELKQSSLFLKILMAPGDFITSGYMMTSKDPDKNKLDLGTLRTLYSYNDVEGNRFRLTFATTKNLHPHLFLYGYGAYGTRDDKFKYYGEATWAFNDVEYCKEEFPRKNLTVSYKNDINSLGQKFTQAERDNILLSLQTAKNQKLTYGRIFQLSYDKEYYSGFSYNISTKISEESPAGNLRFEKIDADNNRYSIRNIKTSEVTTALRYADERFYQKRRRRQVIPYPYFIVNLSHTIGVTDVLGGEYNYNKTLLSASKEVWMGPYGKLSFAAATSTY